MRCLKKLKNAISKLIKFIQTLSWQDFSTEAAWFGKPAIVGGYKLKELQEMLPESIRPPVQICTPGNIEDVIENFIKNEDLRLDLGLKAKMFVRSKWTSKEVAIRYLKLIKNEIPDAWWVEPLNCKWNRSHKKLRNVISKIISEYGIKSLQLSHRPDLENQFLESSQGKFARVRFFIIDILENIVSFEAFIKIFCFVSYSILCNNINF